MKIQVDNPRLVDDLVHHLRRSGCFAMPFEVEAHGKGVMLDVQVPDALDEDHARLEIEVYLKVFEAAHGGRATALPG
jgi:hypothetical protein